MLWCWGRKEVGQLGTVGEDTFSPKQVSTLGTNVAEVAAGYRHTCARLIDGTLWCWGLNDTGQLGSGATNGYKDSPVKVW